MKNEGEGKGKGKRQRSRREEGKRKDGLLQEFKTTEQRQKSTLILIKEHSVERFMCEPKCCKTIMQNEMPSGAS